jgi:N-acetylglucosamine kinase-like BadF-type ATPase
MTELVLGVDGGSTKTVAIAARRDGAVAGAARGGCADLYNASSPDAAVSEIAGAARHALEAAGASGVDVAASCFSLGGADWPEDFELLGERLPADVGLASAPLIVNDAIGAIRAGTADGVGVAVVSGTGGAPGARNARGDVFHLGFWPDGGGAVELTEDALRAVWRSALGLGPPTSLTARALEHFGMNNPIELLHELTRRDGPGMDGCGALAPAVLDEAEAGDGVALEIVRSLGRVLGEEARVAAARVGLEAPYPVVLAGGVLRHPSTLLADAIMERVPGGRAVRIGAEPVRGALLFAFDRAGWTADEPTLAATWPGPELFATAPPR